MKNWIISPHENLQATLMEVTPPAVQVMESELQKKRKKKQPRRVPFTTLSTPPPIKVNVKSGDGESPWLYESQSDWVYYNGDGEFFYNIIFVYKMIIMKVFTS